jgi:hypothetical protein
LYCTRVQHREYSTVTAEYRVQHREYSTVTAEYRVWDREYSTVTAEYISRDREYSTVTAEYRSRDREFSTVSTGGQLYLAFPFSKVSLVEWTNMFCCVLIGVYRGKRGKGKQN